MPLTLALAALLQGAGAQGARQDVQLGVAVRPETVTVGDHFQLTVRVRARRGTTIALPASPDTSGVIELVNPRALRASPDSALSEQIATYRLVAWDTGRVAITLEDALVVEGGVTRRIPLGGARIVVRSVLPRDTTLHVPKPPRDIVPAAKPWWRFWPWVLAGLLAAALLAALIWWWRRRRRARPPVPVDPYTEAQREFDRIDALALLEAGERGRYVALHVDVVRDYLAARLPAARRSLTTSELMAVLRTEPLVSREELASLLSEADLVKFARRPVTAERARQLGKQARKVVSDVESRLNAVPVERAA